MKYNLKTKITILFSAFLFVVILHFILMQLVVLRGEDGAFFHRVADSAPALIKLAAEAKQNNQDSTTKNDIELNFEDNLSEKLTELKPPNDGFLFGKRPPPPDIIEKKNHHHKPRVIDEENNITIMPIAYNDEHSLLIQKGDFKCVAIDKHTTKIKFIIWSLFLGVAFLITMLYYLIIKSLQPLKNLQKEIERFGHGDFQINVQSNHNDEIGQIANAFNEAAKEVKYLIESKDIFLKNAAHELRTPITKGILTTHLLPENRDKEILFNVFKRLENITESIISLEYLSSKDFSISIDNTMLSDIVNSAKDLMFIESDSIDIKFEDKQILADEKLMTIAFKNLIDNGIKFSDDNKIIIDEQNGEIIFKNLGSKIEGEIERYYDAFYKETSTRNAKGSGLGLFLVKKIVNAHNYKILYEYVDGYNIFKIKYN